MLELIAIVGLLALSALIAWGFTLLGVAFWPVFVVFAVCGLVGFAVGSLAGR